MPGVIGIIADPQKCRKNNNRQGNAIVGEASHDAMKNKELNCPATESRPQDKGDFT